MTIRDVLVEIFEKQCNMYLQLEQYDIETLLDSITCINNDNFNEQFLVMAEWDVADIIPNAGDVDVDVNGYIVFYYIIHDDYFYIKKMKNKDNVTDFLLKVSDNRFYKDITVLLDGKIKKYVINHEDNNKWITWVD